MVPEERNELRIRLVFHLLLKEAVDQRENWSWMVSRPDWFPEEEWRRLYVEETRHDDPKAPCADSMRGQTLYAALAAWIKEDLKIDVDDIVRELKKERAR